jgi:hypothetical protein
LHHPLFGKRDQYRDSANSSSRCCAGVGGERDDEIRFDTRKAVLQEADEGIGNARAVEVRTIERDVVERYRR